jgi:hypothetical protein
VLYPTGKLTSSVFAKQVVTIFFDTHCPAVLTAPRLPPYLRHSSCDAQVAAVTGYSVQTKSLLGTPTFCNSHRGKLSLGGVYLPRAAPLSSLGDNVALGGPFHMYPRHRSFYLRTIECRKVACNLCESSSVVFHTKIDQLCPGSSM